MICRCLCSISCLWDPPTDVAENQRVNTLLDRIPGFDAAPWSSGSEFTKVAFQALSGYNLVLPARQPRGRESNCHV